MELILWIVVSLVGGGIMAVSLLSIADDQAHQDKMRNGRPWAND